MTGKQLSLLGGPFGAGAAGDPNWQNVTLLSGTTTTNAGQNNTFIDSSSNAFTITRNGNTTQGTFSPFSQTDGYWSNYFDGSGDYISLPNSSISLGSGNCAVEFWCYITGEPSANPFLFDNYGNGSARLFAYYDGTTMYLNADSVTKTTSFAYNTWNFFQFTRSSGTGGWYLNGNLIDTTFSTSGTINLQRMTIGAAEESGTANPNQWYQGYISNFRASNTNRSTSVPTTPFSSDANAVVLTCQSNRFVDNSASPLTLTITGNAAVIPFQRFGAPIVPYSASTIGGSGFFDGTGDYLTITNNAAFEPNTYVSLECWVYFNSLSANRLIVGRQGMWINYSYTGIGTTADKIGFGIYNGSTWYMASCTTTITTNQWYHVVGVRDSGTLRIYINGVQEGTASFVGSPASYSTDFAIGASFDGTQPITGYLSGVRYCNGSTSGALPYTGSSFTVPTSPPTNTTDTKILANFTNANIYDQSAKNDMETVGNAQVSTSVFKYGTSSAYFDGTGDYLASNSPTDLYAFGTGEFTIEFWVRFNSLPGVSGLYDSRPAATDGAYPTIYMDGAILRYYANSNDRINGPTLVTNTWYHIAVNRSGSSTKMYVDGSQVGATYSDSTNYLNPTGRPHIGAFSTSAAYFPLDGYISDLRVTKGLGRYPYNFTPPTTSLPNFYQAQTLTADPYFEYTTLLLPGSGTNGAQNNTFLDSSTNAFSITRNGNTTQGTFSPFSQTGWSNYFDGTGDYLSTADSISLGSGDFTVGCWVYLNATGAEMPVVCSPNYYRSGYNGNFVMRVGTSNLYNSFDGQSSGAGISGTYSWQTNTWFYVAWVRSGSTITVYRNGMSLGTVSSSRDLSDSANGLYIAVNRINNAIQSDNLNGYISNLRILVGTADTAVPTAPFTAITNTKLLTCQSNRFVDENTQVAAKTITVNGNTSVQAFSPFAPTAAYSAATNGGSGYFDGTGDYLDIANNSVLTPSGDFTIEFWAYVTDSSGTQEWYSKGYGIQLYISSPSWGAAFSANNDGNYFVNFISSSDVQINAWTHFAVTRSGNSYRFFINGVQQGSTVTSSSAPNTGTNVLRIGNWSDTPAYGAKGYMAGVRYLNGTAQYTANFTPPTSPPTAITNTTLLCNFTNAGITDATAKNDLETVNGAQISNTTAKFGSTSIKFDGTTDYLKAPNSRLFDLGSGDFTVEFWAYHNSITSPAYQMYLGQFNNNGTNPGWNIYKYTNGIVEFYGPSGTPTLTSANILVASTWYHIAVTRYGSSMKMFINGNEVASATNSSFADETTNSFYIGARSDTIGTYDMNGYLQDVRITKGIARYTQNFTPPTAAFQLL